MFTVPIFCHFFFFRKNITKIHIGTYVFKDSFNYLLNHILKIYQIDWATGGKSCKKPLSNTSSKIHCLFNAESDKTVLHVN